MDTSIALLVTAAVVAATAGLVLGAYGRGRAEQLHHGSLAWWTAAPWTAAMGAALGAAWPAPAGQWLAAALLLAWAPLSLAGLRRFHARQRLPGHPGLDLGLLGLAWGALACVGWLAPAWLSQTVAVATLALGLYAAAVVVGALGPRLPVGAGPAPGPGTAPAVDGQWRRPDPDLSVPAPLLALALAMALLSALPGLPALAALAVGPGAAGTATPWWTDVATDTLLLQALASALGALVSAFTAQWLMAERTERQLRESRRRLRALANQDALTQVPNRRHFRDLASQALRHDAPGSAVLLMFDIDHFKHINDEGGHAAGDRALCLVSSCMVEHLRTADVAGRHGGDEFVLLLRHAGTGDAMRVAARIVAAIQQRSPALQLPVLTLSFGMVQVGLAEPLDEALRRADQALYEAKRQGRSRAVAAQGDELEPVFSESRRLGLTAL